jgi:hypothetical protein
MMRKINVKEFDTAMLHGFMESGGTQALTSDAAEKLRYAAQLAGAP